MTPMPPKSTTETTCRACGSANLLSVLSLGKTPLANALLPSAEKHAKEESFSLDVAFCETCSLVQITETVSPEVLFGEYLYFSSFSDTMLRHASAIANRLIDEQQLDSDSLVAEVASNDGYLLKNYVEHGVPVLGIEPARNIAAVANDNGVRTECRFFDAETARDLAGRGLQADVIHANNVLAHVADLNGVVEGLRRLLKPHGTTCIEFPYVRDMVEQLEFDTIYHEHLCYFSLTAIYQLFAKHGLRVWSVERLSIHGGSLRVFATPEETSLREDDGSVAALLAEEQAMGIDRFPFYQQFASRVEALKQSLTSKLTELKAQGKRIAAYGASAKGSTLLNYFGIDDSVVDFVVDRSTVKQGHYTPGTHLKIDSPNRLTEVQPDYVLLLTWNFKDEILRQQESYRRRGGKFIVPLPEVKIV